MCVVEVGRVEAVGLPRWGGGGGGGWRQKEWDEACGVDARIICVQDIQ